MALQINSDLKIRGRLQTRNNETGAEFPVDPRPTELWIWTDGRPYMYCNVGGLFTWYPLTQKKASATHVQGVAAAVWNVNHGLQTVNVLVMAYDADSKMVIGSVEILNDSSLRITFQIAITGYAFVVSEDVIVSGQVTPEGMHYDEDGNLILDGNPA